MNKRYEEYEKWFDEFTANYIQNEDGVSKYYMNLKVDHTKKVVSEIEKIAISENLSGDDVSLARLIGLMHDVGRFPQIHKYKIDDDRKTENHAALSVKTLEDLDILKDEDNNTKQIILSAIKYHNMIAIPDEEKDEKTILMSKLIRDADKVDIYRVMKEDIFSLNEMELEKLYASLDFKVETSDAIYEGIKRGISVERAEVKTMLDHTLLQLSWAITDIYFDESKRMIRDRHLIEDIFSSIKSDDRGREIFNLILQRLREV